MGVTSLAEHEVAPALTSLAAAEPDLLVDRLAAVSERLLAHLREGRLDAAVVHQVPVLMTIDEVAWEVVRLGRLAALVRSSHPLASSESVRLEHLREETFLVNPRELAPSAYEGLKLMCQQFGGFEPNLLEPPATSTLPLGPDSAAGPGGRGHCAPDRVRRADRHARAHQGRPDRAGSFVRAGPRLASGQFLCSARALPRLRSRVPRPTRMDLRRALMRC